MARGKRGKRNIPSSEKQARFFGIIAGGGVPRTGRHGLSKAKAKDILRGKKIKPLPTRSRKRR